MTLERSITAKKAKAVFFHKFNDIDIYIEDTSKGSRKLYSEMFTRAFHGKYRIDTVFPLGDKHTVVSLCTADQEEGQRLRLYIVDGDLELLTGCNPSGLRRLFVLDRYSIENYLVDHSAIVSLLNEEDVEQRLEEIERAFAFDDWVQSNEQELFELFLLYAIAKQRCSEFPTTSFPVKRLISSDLGIVDRAKIAIRKQEVERYLQKTVSPQLLDETKEAIARHVSRDQRSKLRFVSGKDLMLLLLVRMRRTTKLRADNEVIKQRLAMKCDVSELEFALSSLG